jgi:hypothetical protein
MSLTVNDWAQIEHVSRMAVLAMCARGVAQTEFDAQPEISRVVISVTDLANPVPTVDVEYFGSSPVPLGGVSL